MSIPKYQQIKQSLLYEINNGKFQPGDKFYSEADLKKKYNVSGITAIKALQCLTNEGYLVRYQGKGTYVSKARRGKIVKFSDIEKYKDAVERTEVLDIRRMKDPAIAAQLNLGSDEEFYHIKRLRLVDDKPIIIQNSYVIREFIKEEDVADKEKFSSIYGKIREDFGIDLYQADSKEITEIVYPAPEEEGALLGLNDQEPSAFTRRYTYLFDGRTIEYIEGYKRWDYFSIEIEPI
ncbi:GntR family transcriptional regulator [Clostridium sp. AN503]|uniref:GntR family transcriptional regulator n=1 Tax=Clostridium sp. AN503 TaxID=3160598 RepID=UPI00345B333C